MAAVTLNGYFLLLLFCPKNNGIKKYLTALSGSIVHIRLGGLDPLTLNLTGEIQQGMLRSDGGGGLINFTLKNPENLRKCCRLYLK